MLSLNTLDIVLLVLLCLSILFGVFRGFIKELFSLVFFIIALILSFLYYDEMGSLFSKSLGPNIANFAGFVAVFVIVLILGVLITYFVKKVFIIGPLKGIDRILGGVFGLVRGILIAAMIVFLMIAFQINERLIANSTFSPYVLETIKVIVGLTPDKFKETKDRMTHEYGRQKNS